MSAYMSQAAALVGHLYLPKIIDSGGISFTTDETLKFENNVLSVNTTNTVEEDNTLPITAAGVYTLTGNITAFLETL